MNTLLENCKVGDKVRVWCIGWQCFDDLVGEVVDNGVSMLVKVKYKSGSTKEFDGVCPCLLA